MTVINVIKWHEMSFYDIYDSHKMSQTMTIWVSNEPSRSNILIYLDKNYFCLDFINQNSKKLKMSFFLCVFKAFPLKISQVWQRGLKMRQRFNSFFFVLLDAYVKLIHTAPLEFPTFFKKCPALLANTANTDSLATCASLDTWACLTMT